jgi:hypothetical protein
MAPGTGIKTEALGMFRLHLVDDANSCKPPERSALNRGPQRIIVDLSPQGAVSATHWAWERGTVLRVEAPRDIITRFQRAGHGSVHFSNPNFSLDLKNITGA